jgi:OmpA-OmpF porin, OOP family
MNLIDEALGHLSAGVIEKASALVGESPAGTRRALQTAVPSLVAALASHAAEDGGAARILQAVEQTGLVGPESAVAERLSGAGGDDLVGLGKDLIGRVLGDRLGPATVAASSAAGVSPISMGRLTGLAAPLVFGVLGSAIHARGLDAAGLAGLLGAQKGPALAALPAAVTAALPREARVALPEEAPRLAPAPRSGRIVRPVSRERSLWPLLLLIIPVALVAGLLFRRPARDLGRAPARLGAGLPSATVTPEITIGSDVESFLASPTGDASRRFTLEDLAFDTATAELTPQALTAIDGVAASLRAHPEAVVLVEGHTDSRGDPAENVQLSRRRANAVRQALVNRGVAEDRITTAAFGQDRPIAPNDTPEGRARNRRTELVVTR